MRKSTGQNITRELLHLIREELTAYMDLLLMVIKENLGGVDNYVRYVAIKEYTRRSFTEQQHGRDYPDREREYPAGGRQTGSDGSSC